jgi:alanyl-tRNA synthetase/misacylated tRNA(Ala) deacylase
VNHFHSDPYARELASVVIQSREAEGRCLAEVDPILFHPKGGGQKGDRGTLQVGEAVYNVLDTLRSETSGTGIALVTDRLVPETAWGQPAQLTLDWAFRYRQMRLHSAAHLHHCMLEQVLGRTLPPPKTSNIEDGFAYNRYPEDLFAPEAVDPASAALLAMISEGAPVGGHADPEREGVRYWTCAGFTIPCGGTHVRDIAELAGLAIEFKVKKKELTITFTLA